MNEFIILCDWWFSSNEGLRRVPGLGLGPRGGAWSHTDSLWSLPSIDGDVPPLPVAKGILKNWKCLKVIKITFTKM